jgi:hypothetical protein
MTTLEKSLQDALAAARLVCLPKALTTTETRLWLKAIGLVKKSNGTQNYALFEYDGINTKLKRDFGAMAVVSEIVAMYPYEFLEKKYIPLFKSEKAMVFYAKEYGHKDMSNNIVREGKSQEQIDKDLAELKQFIFKTIVRVAQLKIDEEIEMQKFIEEHGEAIEKTRQARRGRKPRNSQQQGR